MNMVVSAVKFSWEGYPQSDISLFKYTCMWIGNEPTKIGPICSFHWIGRCVTT